MQLLARCKNDFKNLVKFFLMLLMLLLRRRYVIIIVHVWICLSSYVIITISRAVGPSWNGRKSNLVSTKWRSLKQERIDNLNAVPSVVHMALQFHAQWDLPLWHWRCGNYKNRPTNIIVQRLLWTMIFLNKKAQLTQGLRVTAPSFQDGRQPPS